MGSINAGDEQLHHADGSHRWLRPAAPGEDPGKASARDRAWMAMVRAHVEEHQRSPK